MEKMHPAIQGILDRAKKEDEQLKVRLQAIGIDPEVQKVEVHCGHVFMPQSVLTTILDRAQ